MTRRFLLPGLLPACIVLLVALSGCTAPDEPAPPAQAAAPVPVATAPPEEANTPAVETPGVNATPPEEPAPPADAMPLALVGTYPPPGELLESHLVFYFNRSLAPVEVPPR